MREEGWEVREEGWGVREGYRQRWVGGGGQQKELTCSSYSPPPPGSPASVQLYCKRKDPIMRHEI